MAFWLIDRFLPGLASGALMTAAVAVSHVLARRNLARLTRQQTEEIRSMREKRQGD